MLGGRKFLHVDLESSSHHNLDMLSGVSSEHCTRSDNETSPEVAKAGTFGY